MNFPFKGVVPTIDPNTFIAPNASLIGDVSLASGASCYFGSVLRADEAPILVDENSNIQDGVIIHCDPGVPCKIGKNVTVGHGAVLHSCTIQDGALIGMGAIVLSRAIVGECAIVAAGAVVREGDVVPPYHLFAGVPATIKRVLSQDSKKDRLELANHYVELLAIYKQEIEP